MSSENLLEMLLSCSPAEQIYVILIADGICCF